MSDGVERRSNQDRREDQRVPSGGRRETDRSCRSADEITAMRQRRQAMIEVTIEEHMIALRCDGEDGCGRILCRVSARDFVRQGAKAEIKCANCNTTRVFRNDKSD